MVFCIGNIKVIFVSDSKTHLYLKKYVSRKKSLDLSGFKNLTGLVKSIHKTKKDRDYPCPPKHTFIFR
jgi:hypothetical protein